MRLIDADELIKCIPSEEYNSRFAVMNAPTVELQKWIPVSERPPQKSWNYIVTERRYSVDDRKHEGKYQTIVEEVRFTGEKWERAKFFDIIAWMPLPEPYKEEGEEDA